MLQLFMQYCCEKKKEAGRWYTNFVDLPDTTVVPSSHFSRLASRFLSIFDP
jgi:hypothetical protein